MIFTFLKVSCCASRRWLLIRRNVRIHIYFITTTNSRYTQNFCRFFFLIVPHGDDFVFVCSFAHLLLRLKPLNLCEIYTGFLPNFNHRSSDRFVGTHNTAMSLSLLIFVTTTFSAFLSVFIACSATAQNRLLKSEKVTIAITHAATFKGVSQLQLHFHDWITLDTHWKWHRKNGFLLCFPMIPLVGNLFLAFLSLALFLEMENHF